MEGKVKEMAMRKVTKMVVKTKVKEPTMKGPLKILFRVRRRAQADAGGRAADAASL